MSLWLLYSKNRFKKIRNFYAHTVPLHLRIKKLKSQWRKFHLQPPAEKSLLEEAVLISLWFQMLCDKVPILSHIGSLIVNILDRVLQHFGHTCLLRSPPERKTLYQQSSICFFYSKPLRRIPKRAASPVNRWHESCHAIFDDPCFDLFNIWWFLAVELYETRKCVFNSQRNTANWHFTFSHSGHPFSQLKVFVKAQFRRDRSTDLVVGTAQLDDAVKLVLLTVLLNNSRNG